MARQRTGTYPSPESRANSAPYTYAGGGGGGGGFVPPYALPTAGNAKHIETVGGAGTGFQAVRPGGFSASEWSRSLFDSFGAGIFAPDYSDGGAFIIAGSGGHNHPDSTSLVVFDFTDGTWSRVANANGAPDLISPPYTVGTTASAAPWIEAVGYTEVPAPPHGYNVPVYVPPANGGGTKGSIMWACRCAVAVSASFAETGHRLDLNTATYSRQVSAAGSFADSTLADYSCVLDPSTSRIYILREQYHVYTSVPYMTTSSVTTYGSLGSMSTFPTSASSDGVSAGATCLVHYPGTRLMIQFLQRKIRALDLDDVASGFQLLTLTNATGLPNASLYDSTPVWHPGKSAFYYMPSGGGATLYKITPPGSSPLTNAWVVSTETIGGDTIYRHGGVATGTDSSACKTLHYNPALGMLGWVPGAAVGGTVRPTTLINPA